jgi:hypothetical protein
MKLDGIGFSGRFHEKEIGFGGMGLEAQGCEIAMRWKM